MSDLSKPCVQCLHCLISARPGSGRAKYGCARILDEATNTHADCHDERRTGECGRIGLYWERRA